MYESESKPFVDLGRSNVMENKSGKTDITELEESEDPRAQHVAELAKELEEDTLRQMSPKGSLGLVKKLEEKRWQHGLIDDCFKEAAAFDRILVYQLTSSEKTFANSGIVMPEASEKRTAQETPKGIVVTAGLSALDTLRTNGHQVGDTIKFIKQGMWRIEIGWIRQVAVHLMVLSVGDIISNEDLGQRLFKGEVKYSWSEEKQEHRFVDADGKELQPESPWVGADYE